MQADLELNRTSIGTVWTPDEPIKMLWEKLREIQCLSVAGGDPLTDNAIKDLAFLMFEATGVFTTACNMWHVRLPSNQTLVEFRQHFTTKNKECTCKLTTSQLDTTLQTWQSAMPQLRHLLPHQLSAEVTVPMWPLDVQ